jgi:hypothetical protein
LKKKNMSSAAEHPESDGWSRRSVPITGAIEAVGKISRAAVSCPTGFWLLRVPGERTPVRRKKRLAYFRKKPEPKKG